LQELASEEEAKFEILDLREEGGSKFSVRYEPTCPPKSKGGHGVKDWRLVNHGVRARFTCPVNKRTSSLGFPMLLKNDEDEDMFKSKLKDAMVLGKDWVEQQMLAQP
jgi:hypothetical protein